MAKKPKKKNNRVDSHLRAKRMVFDSLYFSGSAVTRGVKVSGFGKLSVLVPAPIAIRVRNEINEALRTEPRTWYFWVGLFSTLENGDQRVDVELVDGTNMVTKQLELFVTEYILRFRNEKYREYGDKTVINYAWVATPSPHYDLDATSDTFVEHFEALDIYSDEKARSVYAQAKLEQHTAGKLRVSDFKTKRMLSLGR